MQSGQFPNVGVLPSKKRKGSEGTDVHLKEAREVPRHEKRHQMKIGSPIWRTLFTISDWE